MTERQGALVALLFSGSSLADAAVERFLATFEDDPLVVDKWFSLQASAPEQGDQVFERVQRLMRHRDFSVANPNRARSLIGAFCIGNPGGFHRATPPAMRSGPTASSSSTRSTRSWRRRSRARSTAGPSSPSRTGARRAQRSRASPPPETFDRHHRDRLARALRGLRYAPWQRRKRKNAFYAQSGGVTAVINASACGVIETARAHRDVIGNVYAGQERHHRRAHRGARSTPARSRRRRSARCARRPPARSARAATS